MVSKLKSSMYSFLNFERLQRHKSATRAIATLSCTFRSTTPTDSLPGVPLRRLQPIDERLFVRRPHLLPPTCMTRSPHVDDGGSFLSHDACEDRRATGATTRTSGDEAPARITWLLFPFSFLFVSLYSLILSSFSASATHTFNELIPKGHRRQLFDFRIVNLQRHWPAPRCALSDLGS